MVLPIDTDILRMKIQKDIEARHRLEMDQKQAEVERLSENYYESKRQLDILRTQHENLKYENEKELSDLKERNKQELNDLILENQTLQTKCDDRRDRELVRQLRRELDENKRRANDLLSEAADLRKERDQLKLEKNELIISHARETEEERNQKRLLLSDLDKA